MKRQRVLVFDVNETLLDLAALEPLFVQAFGDRRVLHEWFSTLILYSNVATLTHAYAQFGTIAGSALDMVAAERGVELVASHREEILSGLRTLPAHSDVRPALEKLKAAGFRLVTLTNSAPAAVEQQMRHAGLADLFEHSFSVDAVRRFKPAPEVYRHVAERCAVDVGQLRLVAAHAWDVFGALQAGLLAAFVARPGKALYPLGPTPDIVESDMGAVADRIMSRDN